MAKVEAGMESMLDMYFFETNTLLEQLDEILLRTEQANTFTDEDIKEIFRIMHTIKGSSAMMGFENLSVLAHKAEDMFFVIRENPTVITDVSFVYDLVFQVSDAYKAEIEIIQNANGEEFDATDFSELQGKLQGAIGVLNGEVSGDTPKAEAAAKAEAPVKTGGAGTMTVRVFFEDGCKMENLRAFLLINKIKDDCETLEYDPADVESNADTAKTIVEHGFLLTFKAYEKNEDILKLIEEAVNVQSYEVIDGGSAAPAAAPVEVEMPAPKTEAPKAEAPAAKPAKPAPAPKAPVHNETEKVQSAVEKAQSAVGSAQKQSLISVNLQKLDQLHDIVGEIITTESMVISNPDLQGLELESFNKAARQLRKLTDELQDTVMSIRMVPLQGVFQKMNRIVRDMKIKLNKDVDLILEGEQTEVDKSIVDNLNDPLMHLVRNCMDHGIESSVDDRLALGKPAKGKIRLTAQNASGEVIITVADDGGGIRTEKVLEKAKKQGLLTKPETEYTTREINNMILLPGFSTNEQVTEFSGRGVGMDVVKANIEKCGGSIIVDSHEGQGSSFIIKIPLTLAIIDGMEITVGGSIFTVPISTIKESFKAESSQIIRDTERGEMIMIRGICYPILRLHKCFKIDTQIEKLEDGILLLVESDNKSVCLFADELIGEQQVVVKPFPAYLSKYNIKSIGLSGCTIMGDGSISLIIDTNNLISAN